MTLGWRRSKSVEISMISLSVPVVINFLLSSFLWTGGQYKNIMQPNNVFEELKKDIFLSLQLEAWWCDWAKKQKRNRNHLLGSHKAKEMLLSTSLLKWWVSQQFDRSSSDSLQQKCQSSRLKEVLQINQPVILRPPRNDSDSTGLHKLKFEVLGS